jgi:hypothetical protein
MALTVNVNQTDQPKTQAVAPVFTLEMVAYALVILLAIWLRLAELDTVPMREFEARQALAAWRVVQPVDGLLPIAPQSSLQFTAHLITFSLLGANEFSARILTVIGSLVLITSPLWFRDLLGAGQAFILTLILSASPVLLISARTDSAMIWSALAVVLGLWALRRYILSSRPRWAVLATVMLAVLVLLTDPTGLLTALIVLLAGFIAWQFAPRECDELPLESQVEMDAVVGERLHTWPRAQGTLIAVVVIVLLSTLVLIYPAGLNVIGEGLSVLLRGFTVGQPGLPAFYPVLTALFYEPWMVVLGIIAYIWLSRSGRLTLLDRFLGAAALFGFFVALLYRGTGADHVLWMTLPLAGLISHLVIVLVEQVERDPVWGDVPAWARWMVALVGFFLLAMFSVHLQALGRTLLQAPELLLQPGNPNSVSLVWVIISALFMLIGCFLAASVWRVPVTVRGALLGVLAFGLLTSLGSGWRAAVYTSDDATEWWNREAISREVHLLRQTILEISTRETGGEPSTLPVVAQVPADGEVAWTLRDVRDIQFITDVTEARTREIVVLPETAELPDLGGSYVGKSFLVRRTWDAAALQPIEFLAWYLQRRVREAPLPDERVVLWLRQDIYDGVPFNVQP